jgi:uncharacterized protein YciI
MNPFLIITANRIQKVFATAIFFLMMIHANAQSNNSKYDKHLADSLGADSYGMKMYVLAILKTGSNRTEEKQRADSLFIGHMQNIGRLAKIGKLVAAGPLKRNEKEYEGIFILNVKTIEEANALLETDPAIKAKMLDAELYQWYGSAALPLYLQYHDNVKKKDF